MHVESKKWLDRIKLDLHDERSKSRIEYLTRTQKSASAWYGTTKRWEREELREDWTTLNEILYEALEGDWEKAKRMLNNVQAG